MGLYLQVADRGAWIIRNIRIIVEYEGTSYLGWQRQAGGVTIQGLLEAAAGKILQEEIRLIGSGRTDAGVHALNQVANFKTGSSLPTLNILRGMNSLLPFDIAVRAIEEVDESFHSRFNAISKEYHYLIYNSPVRSPLNHNRSWHIPDPLDMNIMNEAAEFIRGSNDFGAFRSTGSCTSSAVRTVTRAGFAREGDLVTFEIEADGFLRHMVRSIVGTLVTVGRGRATPDGFRSILESRDRKLAGMTAPPGGLFLMNVRYR
ncbi:MAG: tRNA pseudouridine(38-40) synthase TruA [Syntrophales bacterium]|nr:tRNA pseudouridine(38-40) synthase TruA [Syntrophales bacterium]